LTPVSLQLAILLRGWQRVFANAGVAGALSVLAACSTMHAGSATSAAPGDQAQQALGKGSAQGQARTDSPADAGADGAPDAAADPNADPSAAADPLPDAPLTREVLFRLVFAEIAMQRGESGQAYSNFMIVARQTRDPRVAHRAAEVAINARAFAQALEAVELWHTLAPHDVEADQSYSSLLVVNGRFERARPMLERQLAESPNPIEMLDRLERVLAHAPDPSQGLGMLESLGRKLLDAPATAFDAHVIVARGAHAAGNDRKTLEHTRAALALRPDSDLAVVTVARLLVEGPPKQAMSDSGDTPAADAKDAKETAKAVDPLHDEAVSILVHFLVAHPGATEVRQAYASLLVSDGRLDEARQQFENLLEHNPQNPDPLFALGVLALESERYGYAREYFQRYLAAVGNSADRDLDLVYLNMGRVAEGQHQFDEALEWLHKVRSPEQVENAREREAFILGHMNRVDDGMKLLEQLPDGTAEERTQRTLAEGQLLRDARRYQESYDLLDKALATSPDDTSLLYETAMSAERLDRIDIMEKRLRRVLELRPDYAHAYNALGYSFADRNIRLPEAYQLINHALTLAPDDGFIVDSLGWVQYRMGNLNAARAALTRAFRLKADPDVAAHLGEVMWASGDHTGARELLLNAQRRDGGDSDTLRETLQRLNIQP
jgi:tetratricopeptide (TPR) repeat protein